MTSRQKAVALEMLQEELKIKLDILDRKYRILNCSVADNSSDGNDLANDQFDQELKKGFLGVYSAESS